MKKIVLTGGGTAGHVTPNIALFDSLKKTGYDIFYLGSQGGIEKELIENCNIPFYSVSSGKLRRYLDLQNIKDIFKVIKGIGDAKKVLKKIKPNVIFSKGGFVSVPVVIAAYLQKIPVIVHESDISPGLANKISVPFAKNVCASFPEALKNIPAEKAVLTGTPIRSNLFKGDRNKGLSFCGFDGSKPVLMVMGGSTGSLKINECLRESLTSLEKKFQIVHLCGKNNSKKDIDSKNYKQFEYLSAELADVLACSDIVLSRAGANAISEFLALKKPCLLIPLSKKASRGDQILNADSFKKQGFSKVLEEETLSSEILIKELESLYEDRNVFIQKMSESKLSNGIEEVMKVITKY